MRTPREAKKLVLNNRTKHGELRMIHYVWTKSARRADADTLVDIMLGLKLARWAVRTIQGKSTLVILQFKEPRD